MIAPPDLVITRIEQKPSSNFATRYFLAFSGISGFYPYHSVTFRDNARIMPDGWRTTGLYDRDMGTFGVLTIGLGWRCQHREAIIVQRAWISYRLALARRLGLTLRVQEHEIP